MACRVTGLSDNFYQQREREDYLYVLFQRAFVDANEIDGIPRELKSG
jgi:hypothetical protein